MHHRLLSINGFSLRFSVGVPAWHELCNSRARRPIHLRRTAMKFETLMLNSLFAACLVICFATLGAMLS
jgi:hypothetical protein